MSRVFYRRTKGRNFGGDPAADQLLWPRLLPLIALAFGLACRSEPPCATSDELLEARFLTLPLAEQRCVWSKTESTSARRSAAAYLRELKRRLPEPEREDRLRGGPPNSFPSDRAEAAVALLSRAVERTPGDAGLWSDLAAARLERGVAVGDTYDYFLAWTAAERALRIDLHSPTARFNRARALTRMALYDQARDEWERYLREESDADWLAEARRQKAALPAAPNSWNELWASFEQALHSGKALKVDAVIARCPGCFREHGEDDLLMNWAASTSAGREREALSFLSRASAIGESLERSNRGSALAAAVTQIRGQSPTERRDMAGALVRYGEALALWANGHFDPALAALRLADRELTRMKSPLAGSAKYRIAACLYQQGDYLRASSQLLSIAREAGAEERRALRGRSLYLLALIRVIEGNPVSALEVLETALGDFQALGEATNEAKVRMLIACSLDYLGKTKEAWRSLHPALVGCATAVNPADRATTYLTASTLAAAQGERDIALLFQNEILRAARTGHDPVALVEALRGRAEIAIAAGKVDSAAQDLEEAEAILRQVLDSVARRGVEGSLLLAEGAILQARSPSLALQKFDRAIPILKETFYGYRLISALHERSRALTALGRIDEAERDLEGAIEESERQRTLIAGTEDRVTYFDRAREILDDMTSLQLESRRRPDLALAYAEEARGRALKDWLVAKGGPSPASEAPAFATSIPRTAGWYESELPQTGLVIAYAVLPQKTVIWALRKDDKLVSTIVTLRADQLRDLVRDFRAALFQSQKRRFGELAAKLHRILIQPVGHLLRPGEHLHFLPDGPLHDLPFALLRSSDGRYLVADHPSSVAPSLRVLAAGEERRIALSRKGQPRRALVVAAPSFDQKLYPTLALLEAGQTEATIGRFFPGSLVLIGQSATRREFLAQAPGFEILHFGGHSVINPEHPAYSQLLFAPEPADPSRGLLYSGDLLSVRLPRTDLVVLASCQSAVGRISRTEGVENLARPFLAAGVPSLVGTLWGVKDQSTADFFLRFYSHLSQGDRPAQALRKAQLEALENLRSDILTWGAFELIGAP